jgi:tetratricopeptide (TPR) repeat protein
MSTASASDADAIVARALAERGAWREVDAWCAAHPVAAARADLTNLWGEALLRAGRAREALERLVPAVPAAELRGDRPSLRRALTLLGAARIEIGELGDAEETFARASALATEDGDDLLVARAANNMGLIANIRGRRDEAVALYRLAIPAYQRLGSAQGLAECHHNMAISFRDTDRLADADDAERRAIDYAREARSARMEALARLGRAEVALRRGDAALAEASARRVASDFRAIGDPVREADACRLAGVASIRLERLDAARELLDAALAATREHGATLNEAETLRARAELWSALGDIAAARTDALDAAALFTRLGAAAERDEAEAFGRSLGE